MCECVCVDTGVLWICVCFYNNIVHIYIYICVYSVKCVEMIYALSMLK